MAPASLRASSSSFTETSSASHRSETISRPTFSNASANCTDRRCTMSVGWIRGTTQPSQAYLGAVALPHLRVQPLLSGHLVFCHRSNPRAWIVVGFGYLKRCTWPRAAESLQRVFRARAWWCLLQTIASRRCYASSPWPKALGLAASSNAFLLSCCSSGADAHPALGNV